MGKKIFEKLDLNSWVWIIGIITLFLFSYIHFDPTDFLRVVAPILIASSFVLLGVFALTEIRKSIKEHYSRKTKNILKDIEEMKAKQEYADLEEQIKIDRNILSLRESLRGCRRDTFEKSVVYSAILFTLTLFLTYIDIGKYLDISNLVVIVLFFFWGIFYFSKMLNSIFVALNIVNLN